MRILLVEDNQELAEVVASHLEHQGQAVDLAADLHTADLCLSATAYELLLLDLRLPDGSGLDWLEKMRARGQDLAVIILTASGRVTERIAGLQAGADDYLVKPFDLQELDARIQAVCRRASGAASSQLRLDDLAIDLSARRVTREGEEIKLTSREWALLDVFLRHPGQLLTRSQLEDSLYAFGAEIESNTLEVYISRLRKKLGKSWLETCRGLGYRMKKACASE
ncbi:response regulator transcription factor [Marinospirillum perlucidum]|uniref:response regulator transcription factor n=1 Tax=Marinospirillum perlucidum TaxID=1982602 RepID=UPI000DF4317E|nr:response regulator transcription factor [Marinospirillum perlucidum]